MNTNHVYAANVKRSTVEGAYALTYTPQDLPVQDGDVYFRTDRPEGYTIDGLQGQYLLGSVVPRQSNLNITTVSLVGDDGILYSHDTVDTNEAIRIFSKLKAANSVNYSDLGTVYVDS